MKTFAGHRTVVVLLVLLPVVGCGKPAVSRPKDQGQVTFQGGPVGDRTLALCSQGPEGDFFAQKLLLGPDGTFSGEVPVPGDYKVVIEESLAVQEGRKEAAANRVNIPEKYRSASTTDLVWSIVPGPNTRNIELTD
jgi:hypothetical protein